MTEIEPRASARNGASSWDIQLQVARELLETKGRAEVERHAMVSRNNRHRCRACFCCACVTVLEETAATYPRASVPPSPLDAMLNRPKRT